MKKKLKIYNTNEAMGKFALKSRIIEPWKDYEILIVKLFMEYDSVRLYRDLCFSNQQGLKCYTFNC